MAAPVGNKYAKGCTTNGAPLKYSTVDELQSAIDGYFKYCAERKRTIFTKDGTMIEEPWPRPHTISGLADYLDVDRKTIVNYANRDEFFPAIARARRKCEAWTEEQLFEGNDRGAKFVLINNYDGWKDKIEQEVTVNTGLAERLQRAKERRNITVESMHVIDV